MLAGSSNGEVELPRRLRNDEVRDLDLPSDLALESREPEARAIPAAPAAAASPAAPIFLLRACD